MDPNFYPPKNNSRGGYHPSDEPYVDVDLNAGVTPIVPVAAAPKDENLYESLMRYHNENDSTSTEDSTARRRRNPKISPATRLKTEDVDVDDDDAGDQKLPAKPGTIRSPHHGTNNIKSDNNSNMNNNTNIKMNSNTSSNMNSNLNSNNNMASRLPSTTTPKAPPPSMPAVVQRKGYPPHEYAPDGPKPGIVHVDEPAIRPDSAMYQAAYGFHSSQNGNPHQPPTVQSRFPEPMGVQAVRDTIAALKQSRESPHVTLSHSAHSTRSVDMGRHPEAVLRHQSGPPDQLLRYESGGRPPEHMMNIGNDDHIGLLAHKTKARNKSPMRIFGKRNSSEKEAAQEAAVAAVGSPTNWYNKHYPVSGAVALSKPLTVERASSLNLAQERPSGFMNSPSPRSFAQFTPSSKFAEPSRLFMQSAPVRHSDPIHSGIPDYGYPLRLEPSQDDTHSLSTAESSIDEELRMALEISKRDTGIVPPPPTRRPTDMSKETSFRREAMAHARQGSNSSLADLLLALKLSAEESGLDHHGSTNLDELLAFEVRQDSRQHMTDFVAAGISTASSSNSNINYSNNNSNSSSNIHNSNSSINHTSSSSTSTSTSKHHNRNQNPKKHIPADQLLILEKIREEQEKHQLELALRASQRDSKQPGAFRMNEAPPYIASQQKAIEEWARKSGSTPSRPAPSRSTPSHPAPSRPTPSRPTAKRENSVSSLDSEGRRQQLLERGTFETKQAIQSGQAHVVICRGCGGRLQAPKSYSLVFCPKCHTISPA